MSGPGKSYRKGISLLEIVKAFQDEANAERWFIETRWPGGVRCAHCDSENVRERANRKPMPYHCADCRQYFSVKTNTLMQSSKLPLRTWAIAFYLLSTNLKGTSSMKLHRDLGITQKSAWHLAHRIRETWADQIDATFQGPAEVDEAYFGGKERNKHAHKRQNAGRGTVGKAIVAGVRDRATNRISAAVVPTTRKRELQSFVAQRVDLGADVYTDDLQSYRGLPNHRAVQHGIGEYVSEQAHVNGMESFWAMMKRGYYGVYHRMSYKHLQRYVQEFAGRHNIRSRDTLEQMVAICVGLVGKRLRYKDLVGRV